MLLGLIIIGVVVGAFFYLSYRFRPQPVKKMNQSQPYTEPHYELPANYGTNEIVALVRDPYWIYAYWEISAATQNDLQHQHIWENSEPVLRVYDVTDNPDTGQYFDVSINDFTKSWYIPVGRPSHTYFIDLGRRLPGGDFISIARSNTVTTPHNQVSTIIDPLWPPIEAIWQSLLHGPGQFRPHGISSPEFIFVGQKEG
jgi:hypothetical protein